MTFDTFGILDAPKTLIIGTIGVQTKDALVVLNISVDTNTGDNMQK
jgi:hypothetical protein